MPVTAGSTFDSTPDMRSSSFRNKKWAEAHLLFCKPLVGTGGSSVEPLSGTLGALRYTTKAFEV
jgi:hypothetical protein